MLQEEAVSKLEVDGLLFVSDAQHRQHNMHPTKAVCEPQVGRYINRTAHSREIELSHNVLVSQKMVKAELRIDVVNSKMENTQERENLGSKGFRMKCPSALDYK